MPAAAKTAKRVHAPGCSAYCVGCGCCECRACDDNGKPCAWAALDPEQGIGLCTVCAVTPIEELEKRGVFE